MKNAYNLKSKKKNYPKPMLKIFYYKNQKKRKAIFCRSIKRAIKREKKRERVNQKANIRKKKKIEKKSEDIILKYRIKILFKITIIFQFFYYFQNFVKIKKIYF